MIGVLLEALGGALIALKDAAARAIFGILAFVAFMAIFGRLLPPDPFLVPLSDVAGAIAPYAGWISWLLPIEYMTATGLFVAGWRFFRWVYARVLQLFLGAQAEGGLHT